MLKTPNSILEKELLIFIGPMIKYIIKNTNAYGEELQNPMEPMVLLLQDLLIIYHPELWAQL